MVDYTSNSCKSVMRTLLCSQPQTWLKTGILIAMLILKKITNNVVKLNCLNRNYNKWHIFLNSENTKLYGKSVKRNINLGYVTEFWLKLMWLFSMRINFVNTMKTYRRYFWAEENFCLLLFNLVPPCYSNFMNRSENISFSNIFKFFCF